MRIVLQFILFLDLLGFPFTLCLFTASFPGRSEGSSAQPALIVFLAEKLNASVCFLFPKKPIGLFGVPVYVTLPEAAK